MFGKRSKSPEEDKVTALPLVKTDGQEPFSETNALPEANTKEVTDSTLGSVAMIGSNTTEPLVRLDGQGPAENIHGATHVDVEQDSSGDGEIEVRQDQAA